MKYTIKITLLTLVALVFITDSYAQRGKNSYKRIYNASTVETVTGTITQVDIIDYNNNSCYGGTHLKLNTGMETIMIHAGPTWFLNDNNISFIAGENIEVKGSRVTYGGEQVIIAATIKRGPETVKLRSDDGTPLWSQRGRN